MFCFVGLQLYGDDQTKHFMNSTGGEVRRVIVSVGQNQKTVFLQTDSLADT